MIDSDGEDNIMSVAFLVDGKHFVSGGIAGKTRRWRIEDGQKVGMPIDVGSVRYSQHRGVTRWRVDRQWDAKWLGDGLESNHPRTSNLVRGTQ